MKTFFLYLLCLPVFLMADSHYEDEANAIRVRTATLIEQGRLRIDQIDAFKNAWAGIAWYTSELSELVSIRSDPSQYTGGSDLQALHALTFEKILVDNLLGKLDVIRPKIDEFLDAAEKVVDQYSELKGFQDTLKPVVISELFDLNETLQQRKSHVEESLDIWRKWQMAVTFQAELENQNEVMDRLEVINDIGQVHAVFNKLWLDGLWSIFSHQFAKSQQLMAGFSWFKSTVSSYFSDKMTTDDQKEYLSNILEEAEQKESQLIALFPILSHNAGWKLLAEEEGGREEGGGEDREGNDRDCGDDFPKSSKDIVSAMEPGSNRTYECREVDCDHTKVLVINITKDLCKYDDAGSGSAKYTIEGKGFIDFDPNQQAREKMECPSGPELQNTVDRMLNMTISKTFSGSVPCDPQTEKEGRELPEKVEQLGKMIDRAQAQAKSDEDKKGLDSVKKEYEKLKNYGNLLNQTVQNKISSTKEVQQLAQNKVTGLSHQLPPIPPPLNPPPVNSSDILDQLGQIRDAMWGSVLSSGRAISSALSGFIHHQADRAPAPLQSAARAVIQAGEDHQKPLPPLPKHSYPKMTAEARQAVLAKAASLRDGSKIIKYSQKNRLGPDSYDCGGFVATMYADAGLYFGTPVVKNLLRLAGPNGPFIESSLDHAEPGDLVIWSKEEGDNPHDHVAIYDGVQTVIDKKGRSSVGPATISTSSTASDEGRNAIQEILIKYMMKDKKHPERTNFPFHIFKWRN